MEHAKTPVHTAPAHLWDGIRQLPGILELWDDKVVFQFSSFQHSHLSLVIQLDKIGKVEEFMVFNLARNGLEISSHEGRCDRFVMEDARLFKETIRGLLSKNLPSAAPPPSD
ncbi:MAG: hypothetical protein H6577_01365 [Lewinellaceae bacterium]|nr:hypothetical protein [Saprospiraceae bacterium]MCB9336754.1 hypothetical protein [Lewinellaceae bacterium]